MKILAAEDSPVFQTMLRSILSKWGYEVVIAKDGTEALEILEGKDAPQLAILDWMMPGADGPEVCRRVRAARREPYTYILLLTARTDSEDRVEGIDAGADDYLTKPFNAAELRARLRAGQRILELQQQLVMAREALRQEATHDSLTGLLNRHAILGLLQIEVDRSFREKRHLSVLMADLDHFKEVNDHYGHLVGDAVLRETAERMKSSIRSYDWLGRYGGEEFLVVLPGCDGAGGLTQAERMRLAVAGAGFTAGNQPLKVTCSVGLTCLPPGMHWDTDALIRQADLALYAAKRNGRNQIVCAAPEIVTGNEKMIAPSPA
ncbi:MAG TPA: diguanylate cyclase [Bryobacteraceae bacterium]|nr:diguanylate cyclase [Bryobacteraceae bacterium]